ncbi:hypothetical protein DBV15_01698 [Temnothorax longispinosus]|uniref:Uncharacterized protein n=1 Tax=Temnothorax longispinosus TaxID=300112 RepID=A0A4S2L6I0_9HYME|nr:hypothetical protein DBV15_01698 [Temnothorax longispinosus]
MQQSTQNVASKLAKTDERFGVFEVANIALHSLWTVQQTCTRAQIHLKILARDKRNDWLHFDGETTRAQRKELTERKEKLAARKKPKRGPDACSGITDTARKKETELGEKWGNFPSGKGKAVLCSTKRYISSDIVESWPTKRERAGGISARKAWAKPPLISENTRRISGLIRRRLTAPIKSSGFALARRSTVNASSSRRLRVPCGMPVGDFTKANWECDIFAGHYNNKDRGGGYVASWSTCVRTRRLAQYIPGDLRICIPPPATPRSPCTRFLISPLTNPFCAWIAAVMDTVWAHSTDRPRYEPPLFSIRPCKLLPLIASVGATVWHDDGNFGHPTKSSIGLPLQRLEAAAVLIDGLHLRIFVPRRRVSRIAAKKTGFTFSGNTGNHDGCLSPACLE